MQLVQKILNFNTLIKIQFISQVVIFLVAICLTPTLADYLTERCSRAIRVLVETIIFIFLILGFNIWIFGISIFGIWIFPTILLILILEIGSNIVEHIKIVTLNNLANEITFEQVKNQAEALENMFLIGLSIYIPVPLSLIIGTMKVWFFNQTPKENILFSAKLFLLLFSLFILFFLCMAFVRMSDTLFHDSDVSSPKLNKEKKDFIGMIVKLVRVIVPPKFKRNSEEEAIELACTVSDLRKIYLYDAIHNSTLLIASTTVLFWLLGIKFNQIWVIGSLISTISFFNLLPYAIGQTALHNKILEQYQGIKRIKLLEKLRKYSPRFPFFNLNSASSNSSINLGSFLFNRDWNNTLKEIINIMEKNEHKRNSKLLETIDTMAEQPKYDQRGANIGSFVDTAQSGSRHEGQANQYNYIPEQRQTLAEAAAEIQQLLEQLEKSYPTKTLSQKGIVAEKTIERIEANKDWKQKVINSVRAMGIEAFMELIDSPVANVLRAGIESLLEENNES